MINEHVEIRNQVVRRWFWAFENDTEAFRKTLHPAFEWFPFEENRTPTYGVEAALRNRNEWLEIWDEHTFDLEEVFEEGEEVVVLVHITACGRTSGIDVEFRFYAHFTLRDGKVRRIYDYDDRASALEAAGLA